MTISVSNSSIRVTAPTKVPRGIGYDESASRYYDLFCRTDMTNGSWQGVPARTNVLGNGAMLEYAVPGGRAGEYYRLRARLE